jgi:hypothetical protein
VPRGTSKDPTFLVAKVDAHADTGFHGIESGYAPGTALNMSGSTMPEPSRIVVHIGLLVTEVRAEESAPHEDEGHVARCRRATRHGLEEHGDRADDRSIGIVNR